MKPIGVYWFDMDHTLINNDCDVSWKHFMVSEKLADSGETERLTAKYFEDYCAGTLDNQEFLDFQLCEFAGRTPAEMSLLAQKHFETVVKPKIYADALALCRRAVASGARCAIVTSTNQVIAKPVAEYFGISELYGAELELAGGRYTGHSVGIYPVGEGKAAILDRFCRVHKLDPADFAYYGDSINDRFLLEKVGHPFAVNPGEELRKLALERQWQILNFK